MKTSVEEKSSATSSTSSVAVFTCSEKNNILSSCVPGNKIKVFIYGFSGQLLTTTNASPSPWLLHPGFLFFLIGLLMEASAGFPGAASLHA